jgi:hypothetical protein
MPLHLLSAFASPELYLDPGSGSLLIQLLLAGLMAAGLAVKLFWSRLKALFGGKPAPPPDSGDAHDDD